MIITVKNLGVIKKAEFDTSKKLTVFCGPNSTGKTYLAYVIYAVLSDRQIYKNLKSFDEIKELIDNHQEQIPLKKEYFDEVLYSISKSCKKRIGKIFGISEEKENVFFKNVNIKLSISDKEYKTIIEKERTIKIDLGVNKPQYEFVVKRKQTDFLNSEIFFSKGITPSHEYLWGFILRTMIDKNVYMLPVERNSIYTFTSELFLNRYKLVNKILDDDFLNNNKKISTNDFIKKNTRRYPLVIDTNLIFANDLKYIIKSNSELYKFAKELEDRLLHGEITISEYGDVEFKVNEQVSLPIGMSSSIVKTLASLILTLKHQVKKGNILIIDEPEMNFHPENQVELAKILAKIANNTPMIVSTHSDYIIRELNNLIVAKSLTEKGKNTYKDFYDKESLLDYNDVQVLYFNPKDGKVNVKSLDVDEYGFAVESIDETISKQNKRTNSLYVFFPFSVNDLATIRLFNSLMM